MNLHPMIESLVQQLSLLIASENPGYDDLARNAAGVTIPLEEVVALAAAYTSMSGTDITQKRIWAERERFVPSLTDAGLRSFFENQR